MKVSFFDYQRGLKKIKKEINLAIKQVLESGQLILGGQVKSFEVNFAKYIGVKYGIGVNSGTDALKIALRAAGVGIGDEVITVANTAVPTISAIREIGANPRFIDIKDDYTIDETKIETAINLRTKGILVVHLYGQACNLPVVSKIANKHKLKLIEDCAQSHGAKIGGKKAGTFGDLSCFSFYPTKNLGAYGDAGIILTSDKALADKCRALRMYGMRGDYHARVEGYNSRLSELQAAILNIKLPHLNKQNSRRQKIAQYYLKNINNPKIILPLVAETASHVFHLFVVRTDRRQDLQGWLAKHDVGSAIHYPWPIHLQEAYGFLNYKEGDLPKTELFSQQIISLPIWPELTEKEIKYIVKIINKF